MKIQLLILNVVYMFLFPLFLIRCIRDPSYRSGVRERFGRIAVKVRPSGTKRIWIHAASMGEVNACRQLVHQLREMDLADVVMTTNTPTGKKTARALFPHMEIFYSPFDFSWMVNRSFHAIDADYLVLIEMEIWPNMIAHAQSAHIPVVVLNGRMSDRSFRRFAQSRLFQDALSSIRYFSVQDALFRDRLIQLGVHADKVEITGNMKFDSLNISELKTSLQSFRQEWNIQKEDLVLLAGSTHDPEERILVNVFKRLKGLFPSLCLILAPRHLTRIKNVKKIIEGNGLSCYNRSSAMCPEEQIQGNVILLDTIGELAHLYAAADLVFVGGSLAHRGGQNMLEPALYGKAVLMGPSLFHFKGISDIFVSRGGLRIVHDEESLYRECERLLQDDEGRAELGRKNREVVMAERGATERNMHVLQTLVRGGLK